MTTEPTKRAQPVDGWQERMIAVCKKDHFEIDILLDYTALRRAGMTEDELTRLNSKLELVAEYARHMAMNMAKGTVKYPNDTYDLDVWLAEEEDDSVDSTNYRLLRMNAMREAGLI